MKASSPEPARDLLFVYGTLRRGFRLHHHLKRLGARFVANGRVQAELLDLAEFPGARPSTKLGKTVEGELYHLHQVETALRVLDQVEGFFPQNTGRSLFHRATTRVFLPNGQHHLAWVYWWNLGASARIHSRRK